VIVVVVRIYNRQVLVKLARIVGRLPGAGRFQREVSMYIDPFIGGVIAGFGACLMFIVILAVVFEKKRSDKK